MPVIRVDDLDDPRLDPFRDVRNRTPPDGRFVAESWLVVRRLLASRYECESIVVSERRFGTLEPDLPMDRPVYRLSNVVADALVGFDFHNGVMGCGVRPPLPSVRDLSLGAGPRRVVVAVPGIADPANLAGLIRTARGLGATALLLGPNCPDPFSRRVLRVSMGNAFFLPVVESNDLASDIEWLRRERSFELVGSTLDGAAASVPGAPRPPRVLLLLGHEHDGLDSKWLDRCDHQVTIPMADDTDSLNVVTAAGILLYHYA